MADASVGAVKLHVGAALGLSLDPGPHLHAAGIDPAELEDPDGRIELARAIRLIESIAAAAPVPSYGLGLGEHFHPTKLSLVGYLVMNAESLRDALELFCRYQQVIGGAFIWRLGEPGTDGAWLEMVEMRLPAIATLAQEWSPAAIISTLRVLSAEAIAPRRACFAHAEPSWSAEYARVFRCPCEFDAGRTGLWLDDADLDKPVVHREPALQAHFQQLCERALSRLEDELPLSRRVLDALLKRVAGEEPSIAVVARDLSMSTRSLQAQLQDEGTSYKALLARARRELSEHHLRDRSMSIAEVSFLLGFSEPSAFHRAFKRWTGSTPAAYRNSLAG